MKISIITPVYNREDCIHRCIESITAQAEETEHWIVNDGSTDATLSIIQQYADKYPPIHVLTYERNAGVSAARNAAIRKCTGDYVLFLDSDDYLAENAINYIQNTIKETPAYLHYLFATNGRMPFYETYHLLEQKQTVITYFDWLRGEVGGDFVHVMKREMLQKFPFNEELRIYEETNFLRLHRYSKEQLFTNQIIVYTELNRKDSVSLQYRLNNSRAIHLEYKALRNIIYEFYNDYMAAGALGQIQERIRKYRFLAIAVSDYSNDRLIPQSRLLQIFKILRLGCLMRMFIIIHSHIKYKFRK